MGYIADEPMGDDLDDRGLDDMGKHLRDEQRKAQAIDRELIEGEDCSADGCGLDPGMDSMKRFIEEANKSIADTLADVKGVDVTTPPGSINNLTATEARAVRDSYRRAFGGGCGKSVWYGTADVILESQNTINEQMRQYIKGAKAAGIFIPEPEEPTSED